MVWQALEDGIELSVRLTPKARQERLAGTSEGADGRPYLNAWVRSAPERGQANAALRALLARELGVPASKVALVSGATARLKRWHITGDSGQLGAQVALWAEQRMTQSGYCRALSCGRVADPKRVEEGEPGGGETNRRQG